MQNWKSLPFKLQEKIVQFSTENTRNALRACSRREKELMEKAQVNIIDRLEISCCGSDWVIDIDREKRKWPFNKPEKLTFKSFDEFQNALFDLLEPVHGIKVLKIEKMRVEKLFRLRKEGDQQNIRVEKLKIELENGEIIGELLSQAEPVYLRKVVLATDGGNPKIYDMEQIVFAEKLIIDKPACITEDQLLKLQAEHVRLNTNCPLERYLNKCVLETDPKLPQFVFTGQEAYNELKRVLLPTSFDKHIFNTKNPQLHLELTFEKSNSEPKFKVTGLVRFDSERTASLLVQRDESRMRTMKCLSIKSSRKMSPTFQIQIERKNHLPYNYGFGDYWDFQDKLDEILPNLDYVEELKIDLKNQLDWDFNWNFVEGLLNVHSLTLKQSESMPDFWKGIDPICLKHLVLKAEYGCNVVYTLPHVQNCSYAEICGPIISDDELMEINTPIFIHTTSCPLTSEGINCYLRKCLHFLDTMPYDVELRGLPHYIGLDEITPGLQIITGDEDIETYNSYLILDSPYPDFVLKVSEGNNRTIHIKRLERSDCYDFDD